MKAFIILLLVCCLISKLLPAQHLSLRTAEVACLKQLIEHDSGVNALYNVWLKQALDAARSSPAPVAVISSAGRLKSDPTKQATAKAIRDLRKIYAAALCYRVSGNRTFLTTATRYLLAWATTNQASANPIDDTNLDPAIEAYDLIKDHLEKKERTTILKWLNNTAAAELTSKYCMKGRETAVNNWNSHRLKILGEIALATNNARLKKQTAKMLTKHLAVNLNADGSTTDFKLRDALHYQVYDLEPLVRLALILRRSTNRNYYDYKTAAGGSIRKSVAWLLPYLNGDKSHQEFVHTTIQFDIDRSKNKEEGHEIGKNYEVKNSIKLLSCAASFQPELDALARKVNGTGKQFYSWESVLTYLYRQNCK